MYARTASGFVKRYSALQVFAFNLLVCDLAIYPVFTWGLVSFGFPSSQLALYALISTPVIIALALTYILMSTVMPRAGGDYVYVSRVIHPVFGFLSNWGFQFALIFVIGWWAYLTNSYGLGVALSAFGWSVKNFSIANVGVALQNPSVGLPVGAITLAFAFFLAYYIRQYNWAKIFSVLTIIGVIGFLLSELALFDTSNSSFQSLFNSFGSFLTGNSTDYYHAIIQTTPVTNEVGFGVFIGGFAMWFFSSVWAMFGSSYIAGEIKEIRKNQFIGVLASVLVVQILATVLFIMLLDRSAGLDFTNSANLAYYIPGAYPLPIPPYPQLFSMIAAANPVLILIIGISVTVWTFMLLPTAIIVASRSVVAWSMDRILPQSFSNVDAERQTPNRALIAVFIVSLLFLISYSQNPTFFAANFWTILFGVTIFSIGISAMLLPKLQKSIYEQSPIRAWNLGKIPIISILGAVVTIATLVSMYELLFNPGWVWGGAGQVSLKIYLTAYASAALIYGIGWAYRKRHGVDVLLVQKELPPE